VKIRPRDIPRDGLTLHEDVVLDQIGLDQFGLHFKPPAAIDASVMREGVAVQVKARFQGTARLACFRCLKEFDENFDRSYTFMFNADQHEIDITEAVRQEVTLDFPAQQLCSKTCKGLCPRCGKDLNEGTCSCT
jgi:uncharacterized protein